MPPTRLLVTACIALSLLGSCGGGGGGGGGGSSAVQTSAKAFAVQLGSESTILSSAQRTALGFQFGPPDGNLGVVRAGGVYTFFAAALASATCAGTPLVQGTYRLGGTLSQLDGSFGCAASMTAGNDPNGYSFDRDYAGGGPTIPITGPQGQSGLLQAYHGEWHGGLCGTGTCFYASLGLAVSTDGGATFSKLGEIIQPTVTRTAALASAHNIDLGGGTLVIADELGQHIANLATFDPSRIYLYVLYSDTDTSNTLHPCEVALCLALARARLADVSAAAFAHDSARFPALFNKYYQGAFSEPATSHDADAALASGHYTPIVAEAGLFASVIYDSYIGRYLLAYTTGNDAVVVRSGTDLLHWATPISGAAVSEAGIKILYPTLVGEGDDPMIGANSPQLVYIKASNWPNWASANLIGRSVQLSTLP